jgi:thiosulfate dehydrogenase (quinone) large subunit
MENLALTYSMLLLRLWLAVRALQTGIEKFSGLKAERMPLMDEFGNPDASGIMVEVKKKFYSLGNYHGVPPALESQFQSEPLIPGFFLPIYDKVLGPALLGLGLTLLLGIATRTTLFLMGLLYISLTWGLVLIGQDGGVAWLASHMILIAFALYLAKYNRFEICKKW